MAFWTYMLRCADGSFYVGHSEDLEGRLAAHGHGDVPGYTAARRPVALVWSESFGTREEALSAELRLKGWSRANKKALIEGDWTRIGELARNRQSSPG